MKKYFIPIFFILFYSGCSFKLPYMPYINDEESEANKCKTIYLEKEKIVCYEKLKDNSYAQLRLGTYYADKKEFDKAFKYLNASYENDNIYSNLALAFLYFKGDGVKQDLKKSFDLLNESSDTDPNAAFQLSRFYLKGVQTQKDTKKAIELLEFAANEGLKTAQKRLFEIYNFGFDDIKKDEEKARKWEEKIKEAPKDTSYEVYKL